MRVYPKVSRLAAWSDNCKWHGSLPLVQLYRYFMSQVRFAAITLRIASQRVFVVVDFVIDSIR
jgi:hypothetical protein